MLQWAGGASLILSGALAFGVFSLPRPAAAEPAGTTVQSVCDLKASRKEGLVSVMTGASYDFEYGYFLSTRGCKDPVDGTGVLRIDLPPGKSVDDFPELAKLSSRTWLGASVGKRVRFQGTGQLSFADGHPRFVLSRVDRVWASDD